MFLNLQEYLESSRENIFNNVPITFTICIKENDKKSIHKSLRPFTIFFKVLDSIKDNILEITQKLNSNMNKFKNFDVKIDSDLKKQLFIPLGLEKKGIPQFTKYIMPLCHFTGNNFWILKPTSFNRGRGIHVFNNLKKLKELIKSYLAGRKEELYRGTHNICQQK